MHKRRPFHRECSTGPLRLAKSICSARHPHSSRRNGGSGPEALWAVPVSCVIIPEEDSLVCMGGPVARNMARMGGYTTWSLLCSEAATGWLRSRCSLQDQALLLLLLPGEQGGAGGMLEDLAHALVRLGRALEVFLSTDLLADIFGLWWEGQSSAVFVVVDGNGIPARESRASATSCGAPRWSSGRTANPSCSRRG